MSKVFVIAPVLNEAPNMPELVKAWSVLAGEAPGFHFCLIDDGSTDGTAEAAKRLAQEAGLLLDVVTHSENRGPGAAFGSGFSWLSGRLSPGDIVVTMEGDNTSRGPTLSTMLARMEREGVDVALASPYAWGGGIVNTSFHRTFLSHVANGLVKFVVGIHGIHTMSSFFRAYRGQVVLDLQKRWGPEILESPGFECMIELLKKICLRGATITEVPMRLDTSLRKGKSKMKVLRTIRGYFRVMARSREWTA